MRYLVAMIFAVTGAALAMIFVAGPLASYAVQNMKFSSPDQNDNYFDLIYMATNAGGLVLGWLIGWVIGGPLRSGPRPS